jgi:hypothetical protein
MKSSGLFNVFPSILYAAEAGLDCPEEETMSLTVFLALCVLGIDFMIYAFFQWTYGNKRSASTRQIAAHRNALAEPSARPLLIPHKGLSRDGQKLTNDFNAESM